MKITARKITDQLDTAIDDALLARSQLHEVQRIMNLSLPGPGAQTYDTGGPSCAAWCERHQRRVEVCHRTVDPDHPVENTPFGCLGTPELRIVDPTGDQAARDRVWPDAWEARRRAARMAADADWFVALCKKWLVSDPTPDRKERLNGANRRKCQQHLRFGYDVDARGKAPTRVRFKNTPILQVEYWLCEWCEKDVRARFEETGEQRLAYDYEIRRAARRATWKLLGSSNEQTA